MRVEIIGDVDEFSPGTIQIRVHDPLSSVFEIALITLHPKPGERAFRTAPPSHFFATERSDGTYPGFYGYPGDVLKAAQRYAAGEIDKKTAESEMTYTLEGWSRATDRNARREPAS